MGPCIIRGEPIERRKDRVAVGTGEQYGAVDNPVARIGNHRGHRNCEGCTCDSGRGSRDVKGRMLRTTAGGHESRHHCDQHQWSQLCQYTPEPTRG
jgi:hypothetical protein